MHQDAFVWMDSVASHCFLSDALANTSRLKVKKDNNTFVLGNGDQVPLDMHIAIHVKIQQLHNQTNALFLSWAMILTW